MILFSKLSEELSTEQTTRAEIEQDFQRRWDNAKADLDDVIRQLESEKVERKKAWEQEAKLESDLNVKQIDINVNVYL